MDLLGKSKWKAQVVSGWVFVLVARHRRLLKKVGEQTDKCESEQVTDVESQVCSCRLQVADCDYTAVSLLFGFVRSHRIVEPSEMWWR